MAGTLVAGNGVNAAMDVLDRKLTRQFAVNMHACVHCGLCSTACHYFLATGDPRMTPVYKTELLRKLYKRKYDWMGRLAPAWVGARDPDKEMLDELYEAAWGSCTMCRRCTMNCPNGVDTALLIRTARAMLTSAGQIPKGLKDTVDIHLATGNNMGVKREEFIDTVKWMEEELQKDVNDPDAKIPIDKIGAKFFLTLNPKEIKWNPLLLQAQAKIFYAAGEDWTLSSNVWDATNYALFSGDDKAAQEICNRLIKEAERLQAKAVVMTECGHGYRVMRWEADNWVGRSLPCEVKSFSEVVADYIARGRINLNPSVNKEPVTYHDPCNQARSGGIIDEPRYILRHSVTDFREMTPHGTDNICCGGGGGALTISQYRSRRLEAGRVKAEQIKATGARIVATSCHNCIDQISELSRHYGLGVQVKNTCELVADAVRLPAKKASLPLEVDDDGYLKQPSSWDRRVGQLLANDHNVGDLTEKHWRILEYVREYSNCHQSWPIPRRIHKDVGFDPRRLFPGEPDVVFKVAGLACPKGGIHWDTRSLRDSSSKRGGE